MPASAQAWKKHFLDMAAGKLNSSQFYSLGQGDQQGGSSGPKIELVTPTQQAVEMAKSEQKQHEGQQKQIKRSVKRRHHHLAADNHRDNKKKKTTVKRKEQRSKHV